MAAVTREVEALLRKKGIFEQETHGTTLRAQMFEGFKDKEAEELRRQYLRLNNFNESWIPAIKAGGYRRFQLYDLSKDPEQKTDLAARFPDVVARLKQQLLEINASVMADAPDWAAAQAGQPVAPKGS